MNEEYERTITNNIKKEPGAKSNDQRVIIKSYRQGIATAGCFSKP